MNYNDLSKEELQAKRFELQNNIETLRMLLHEVVAAYHLKLREEELTNKLGGLSADEVEFLQKLVSKQSMSAPGIESNAEVGNPGS